MLTLLALAAAACTANTTGADLQPAVTFDNSPLHVPTGLRDGDGTLTSDLGITYDVTISNHRIEPPVLWDGTWTLRDSKGHDVIFQVGDPDLDGRTGPDDLARCWQLDPGDATSARSVRCAQGILLRVAADDGYAAAETLLRDAFERTPDETDAWTRYCHLGGTIIAAGAVIGGEAPETVMTTHRSLCDFAVSHGVGAAVATLNPANPAEALRKACQPGTDPGILPYSYGSQCWHGGGMGLARLHRFDYTQGLDVCRQAPDPGWAGNCIEGMFVSYRDYSTRFDEGEAWTINRPTMENCNRTPEPASSDLYYLNACYRYSAVRIYKNLNIAELGRAELDNALEQANSIMGLSCATAQDDPRRYACWTAAAHLIADIVGNDIGNRELIARWAGICESAPGDGIGCYQRYFSTLVENPQRRDGVPLDDLLAMAPAAIREELSDMMTAWLETVADRGTN
jgi:hypothetical protein